MISDYITGITTCTYDLVLDRHPCILQYEIGLFLTKKYESESETSGIIANVII